MKEYEIVRKQLTDLLDELDERLTKITNDVKHISQPIEVDSQEQATQNENNEVQDALGIATQREMRLVRQALDNIDKGHYGICQQCGESIGTDRLKALPFVQLCIQCANSAQARH